jgi:hypothetical protein
MNQNKVNPWMISTVVLALVGGFLIGCEVQSPRQQLGAQTSTGVTASEMSEAMSYYFPRKTDYVFESLSIGPGTQDTIIFEVPPDKVLVVYPDSFLYNGKLNGSSFSIPRKVTVYPGDVITVANPGGTAATRTAELRGHLSSIEPDPANPLVNIFDELYVRNSDWVLVGSGFTVPSDRSFMLTDVVTCCLDDSYLQFRINGSSFPLNYDSHNDDHNMSLLLSPGDYLEGTDTSSGSNAQWTFCGYWVR